MSGEINPVNVLNVELIPSDIPAKFGDMSTTEASAPLLTEPCNINEIVNKVTAVITSHPENAKPITNNPFNMRPIMNLILINCKISFFTLITYK